MRPYLRVANVFEDRIDLSDVMEMDFSPEEYERFKLEPGDILLNEGQSPEWVGRPAMYNGELPGVCFTNSLIRFRPQHGIVGKYALLVFRHLLHSRRFMREARITTNIAHLSSTRFASVEFPVPPTAEQERIVAAVEEYLSRLDAADTTLERCLAKLRVLTRAVLDRIWESGSRVPLGSVADIAAGPAFRSVEFVGEGDGVRLLRGDNIEPGALRWRHARFWPFDRLEGFDHLRVAVDDLILAMDRPVISTGLKLARVTAGDLPALLVQRVARIRLDDRVDVSYVHMLLQHPAFVAHLLAGQTGTQVPHVTLDSIRSFEVPVPDLARQREIARQAEGILTGTLRTASSIITARARGKALGRSLLGAAFTGKLVPQNSTDEPASLLLERIRADRAASAPARRRRRA
jgi:type I restriction enzyme S subunit